MAALGAQVPLGQSNGQSLTQPLACETPTAARTHAAEQHFSKCSPGGLLSPEETPGKSGGPSKAALGARPRNSAVLADKGGPAAGAGGPQALLRSPFQAAQPLAADKGAGKQNGPARIAAFGSRRPAPNSSKIPAPAKGQTGGMCTKLLLFGIL